MADDIGASGKAPAAQRRCSVVISQPMYFAWPGFFEQMALADVYIWLTDTQFSKGSFTNRIQVKLDGDRKWMSIPLKDKGTNTLIDDLMPGSESWRASHRDLLRQSFKAAPAAADALAIFDQAVSEERLVDCLIASAELPGRALGVLPPKILRSSAMDVGGRSWQRVLYLVKAVGGTHYITGHGAAQYLDHEEFERQGVDVEYMDYSLAEWPQPDGHFTPYVTVLNLIAAAGGDARTYLSPRTVSWRTFLDGRRAAP
jgi:hypothetical protein